MKPGDRILRLSASILRQVADRAPLEQVLAGIVGMVESIEAGVLGSILLLDAERSRVDRAVGPSLPPGCLDGLIGHAIGPGAGSCGAAMYSGRRVVTEDVRTDPNWSAFLPLAEAAGVLACWSEPILDAEGRVIGSFAIYRPEPGGPSQAQLRLIDGAHDLVRLAVEIDRSRQIAAEAEKRLAASEARYRSLFEHAPVGLFVNQFEGGLILAANPAMAAMAGREAEALRALRYADLLPPAYAEQERAAVACLRATGSHPAVERQMLRSDGSLVDIAISAVLMEGQGGTQLALSAVQDISAQKRTERNLRMLGERLALAIEASGLGVFDFDFATGDLVCNRRLAEIYGFERPDGLDPACWIARVHPEDRDEVRERLALARSNALPSRDHTFRVMRPDGSVRQVHSTARVLCEGTRAVRLVGVNRDVTAEVEMAGALELRTREAEAATLAKSQFLANMSHEIRTPLNGVLGAAQLLEHGPLTDAQRGYVGVIRSSGEALLELIEDLLDLSRIEAGVIQVESVPFDCRSIVAGALGTVRGLAGDKGLSLTVRTDPAMAGWFLGDPRRIRQVLLNLLGNAVKFTETGGIALSVSRSGDHLRFSIADTGCGIPQEHQETIFARFSQAAPSHAGRHRGTGLGLSICRELVALMGGRIGLESRPGAGSTFWFDLPCPPCDAPAAAPCDAPAAALAAQPGRG